MKRYQNGLWGAPGLKELNKKNESEGQKKAKTSGERRPMAGAAMLAHIKEPPRWRRSAKKEVHG
jgi:hypothetical protein